jgi:hypothetical protein
LPDALPLIEGCFVPRVRERLLVAPIAGSA